MMTEQQHCAVQLLAVLLQQCRFFLFACVGRYQQRLSLCDHPQHARLGIGGGRNFASRQGQPFKPHPIPLPSLATAIVRAPMRIGLTLPCPYLPESKLAQQTGRRTIVVGIGMRSHVGLAAKMFKSLAEEGINIQMISTSEIKISVLIDEKYLELAVRALHKAFGLDQAD